MLIISLVQWFDEAQKCILDEVLKLNDSKPFSVQEREFAQEQMKLLSTSSDTKGIKFSSLSLHYQYYQSKFQKRALLMYQVLSVLISSKFISELTKKKNIWSRKGIYDKFKQTIQVKKMGSGEFSELVSLALMLLTTDETISELVVEENDQEEVEDYEDYSHYNDDNAVNNTAIQYCIRPDPIFNDSKIESKMRKLRVASIGGGPGNDSAAFVVLRENVLSKIFDKGITIDCDLYDLEKNWKNYLTRLQELTNGILNLDFNRCDVTKNFNSSLNRVLKGRVTNYDMFLFSYVCNETSHLTKQSEGIFLRELFTNAKPFSIFVFVDVIEHAKKALLYVESLTKTLDANCGNFVSYHPPSNQAEVMVIVKY